MLDHVSVGVTNIDCSRRFYDATLRPLGLVRIVDFGSGRGSDYGAAPSHVAENFDRMIGDPSCWSALAVDGETAQAVITAVAACAR